MMTEYTLLTTLAFHHLVIGGILIIVISVLHTLLIKNIELKSWLWMTAFVVSTLTPFTLISVEQTAPLVTELGITELSTNTSISDANQLLAPVSYKVPEETGYWHLPANIVFNFSMLVSLGLFIWTLGSAWRVIATTRMYLRTKQLLGDIGTRSEEFSHYIGKPVHICQRVSSPMVVGYWRPVILMPTSILEQLDKAQIQAILQHENAHIQRKDNWFALFQECIAIVFWWSPVMRLLNNYIHVEREIACDLRAASQLSNTRQYAQSLVDCAKLMVHQQQSVLAMGLFSKKKELTKRIGIVLKNKVVKKVHSGLIALICLGLSISTIQAAQTLAPKISIKQTKIDSRHYSLLPFDDGQALIEAVMQNDIQTIQDLQAEGVDINTPAIGDGTALMIAVKMNNRSMVDALIGLGADVNQSSRGDGNPLILAAARNNIEMAEALLNQGANIDAIVINDETALINASLYSHIEMTQFLIDRGADVNIAVTTGFSDGNEVRTALNRSRDPILRDLLIANGATQ
ncbi:MAG: beta-lactamase regulating signal transducer with metallopeptidase domain [Alphaproteobacteria bacterium]|jgi:beta-lactamase regulating signal transducer with metallopeptidase domain